MGFGARPRRHRHSPFWKNAIMGHMIEIMERQEGHIMTGHVFRIGDIVSWNSEAGHVSGRITAIRTTPFLVNGYQHHATLASPQYEIVSLKTGHVAHHRGDVLTKIG